MRFVEAERVGSIQAVEDMLATAVAAYRAALKHDGLPADTKFAVFSPGNPFVPFVDQYREMAGNVAVHGYEGLGVRSRGVYRRKRHRQK